MGKRVWSNFGEDESPTIVEIEEREDEALTVNDIISETGIDIGDYLRDLDI